MSGTDRPLPDETPAAGVLGSAERETVSSQQEPSDYDPAIYSPTSVLMQRSDGSSEWVRLTWEEVCADLQAEIRKLRRFRQMVCDLDRNEHGRHEGDADVGNPTGISQGNPRLHTGDVLGYTIGGTPYVMPGRGQRHDATAWGAR